MMAAAQQFKEGDKVRDRANLGGQVLETWGNGVKVSWRNGYTTWIDERFLSPDTKARTLTMTDRTPIDLSLPRHAADKVKRAMDDVMQLTDNPGEMLRIALLSATAPIGAAAGILRGMMDAAGTPVTYEAATAEIMRLITLAGVEGGPAAWDSLRRSHGESVNTAKEG